MSSEEIQNLLRALIEGEPVSVLEENGCETQVYRLEFRGQECMGFRTIGEERLIALEEIAAVIT